MNILHAFWLPEPGTEFVAGGALHLWAETAPIGTSGRKRARSPHPFAVSADGWSCLQDGLGEIEGSPATAVIQLPSVNGQPLPSPQASQLASHAPPDGPGEQSISLQPWQVPCISVDFPIKALADAHFIVSNHLEPIQAGSDFAFFYWFTQSLKALLMRDQYLPALRYGHPARGRGRKRPAAAKLFATWQWAETPLEHLLDQAAACMPAACGAGCKPPLETRGLLRHCADVVLDNLVRETPMPNTLRRRLRGTLLEACVEPTTATAQWDVPGDPLRSYRRWQTWYQRVTGTAQQQAFTLGLRLVAPVGGATDSWLIEFLAIALDDPSHQVPMKDYWAAPARARKAHQRRFGDAFEQQMLLNLGLAARMVPIIWDGLDVAQPHAVELGLDDAFRFLKEWAWILEDAGYRVLVPGWWTPEGRRRAKIRLRPSYSSNSGGGATPARNELSLERLLEYRYELAIGDQVVSEAEWQQLVEAKTPLVQFRGQWVELDAGKMREMLALLHDSESDAQQMSVRDIVQRTAFDDDFEIDPQDALATMLDKLRDHSRLEPVPGPAGLHGELRDYQKRGLDWLGYLEALGLSGCLADDMGLGKTVQVIARLVQEREQLGHVAPSLLIAPTSVIGNWQKEVERFAPMLRTFVHHGANREKLAEAFKTQAASCDLVLTSYSLARADLEVLSAVNWRRVILDEAQNIKNPKAAQTRAVLKLQTELRVALTGTPVENRLGDLWSIFNFLNPGYLDTQAAFRKRFELPVQRDRDAGKTALLKRLVQPFVLRRLKTDKSIIADLPDKVEAVAYCNLSREQGALYESVVQDVERRLAGSEGIARQGLMLSTLTRLKQICNHPAQFLQDGSAFTAERSHKLERLQAMLEEVVGEGDSVLIFSQFTESCEGLVDWLRGHARYPCHYLHGATSRIQRERMIEAFQDPAAPPCVFVLSLKAGGVGITLTKANHVFHFDRWWNPAVEDQASDRAYRIGQNKTVFVHKFVTIGTLEERINEMIEQKKSLAESIVGDGESWLAQVDDEQFRELIALNRDAVMS